MFDALKGTADLFNDAPDLGITPGVMNASDFTTNVASSAVSSASSGGGFFETFLSFAPEIFEGIALASQASAASQASEAEAQAAEFNAEIARQNGVLAAQQGAENERRSREITRRKIASSNARRAGMGMSTFGGNASDLINDSLQQGELLALIIFFVIELFGALY